MMLPIETERLTVRSFEAEDWTALLAYMSQSEVVRYLPEEPFAEMQARQFINKVVEAERDGDDLPEKMAVILKSSGSLIGHLVFEVYNRRYRTWEIGWVFHPAYHGQGYATEASEALLSHGFESLNLHRVIATCDPRNSASYRIMEKLGMRREAHFKKDVFLHGQWADEYFYAILKEEWQARLA
jgi:ribosomal-protein-alanine N-acetyltransferase